LVGSQIGILIEWEGCLDGADYVVIGDMLDLAAMFIANVQIGALGHAPSSRGARMQAAFTGSKGLGCCGEQ